MRNGTEKTTAQKIIEGLQIIIKHDPDSDICAEHDEMFFGHTAPDAMPKEDATKLENLGWSWDDNLESWQHFV